jgi:hypothetical protein
MSHSVSEQAARAVKNSERQKVETRTRDEIIKDLRLNVKNRLYVAPLDIELLLSLYDAAVSQLAQYSATSAAKVEV